MLSGRINPEDLKSTVSHISFRSISFLGRTGSLQSLPSLLSGTVCLEINVPKLSPSRNPRTSTNNFSPKDLHFPERYILAVSTFDRIDLAKICVISTSIYIQKHLFQSKLAKPRKSCRCFRQFFHSRYPQFEMTYLSRTDCCAWRQMVINSNHQN